MKIRIKGNSLRYRLTKSDIEHFSKDGYMAIHQPELTILWR